MPRCAALAPAAAMWAAATYAAAVVVNRRLELGFTESVQDSEFQLVLLAVGAGVGGVAGLPLLFGWWVYKAVRDRTSAGAVTGTVVFRGEIDPRRGIDDNRR